MMFKEGKIKIFSHTLAYRLEHTPDIPTVGITNMCTDPDSDKMYIPFLDYDNVDYSIIKQDLDILNRRFGLCTFYILSTSESKIENQWGETKLVGNYLVIGLDKLTFLEHCQMMSITRSDVLPRRTALSFSQRYWVVRIQAKYKIIDNRLTEIRPSPKLKEIVHFNTRCKYKHCLGMYTFLSRYFNPKQNIILNNFDNCKEVELIEYNTKVKR